MSPPAQRCHGCKKKEKEKNFLGRSDSHTCLRTIIIPLYVKRHLPRYPSSSEKTLNTMVAILSAQQKWDIKVLMALVLPAAALLLRFRQAAATTAKLATAAAAKLPQPGCRCLYRRRAATAYTATVLPPPPLRRSRQAAAAAAKLPQPRCRCLHCRRAAAAYTAAALPPPPPLRSCQAAAATAKLAADSSHRRFRRCCRRCI